MSRRDDGGARALASRRSAPAGASPASVSTGAPSSRPQTCGESRVGQARCQEPLRREPARGPQHKVKPAASANLQPESRAAHVTGEGHVCRAPVGGRTRGRSRRGTGAQHVCTERNGTREARVPSPSQGNAAHISHRRASEGTVVVRSRPTNNGRGAKGPCGATSTQRGRTRA